MPSSTRSNKDKHLLFSEDLAHLEHTIHKKQRSTPLDAAAFTSTDSRMQPSTDTRPSSSTDLHRSTSIDTTPRTSIDHQSRNMVAIVILRQDENGNMYDQDDHLRNATCQKLDAQGNVDNWGYVSFKKIARIESVLRRRSCLKFFLSLGSDLNMRGDRFSIFREFRSVCKICRNSHGTIYRDRKNRLRLSSLDYPPRQGRTRDAKDDLEDLPGDEILATYRGVRGRMVRPWREADGRILILGFRSISFLIRDCFSTIVVRFSKVVKCCQL
ncbi:hypothetical protein F2Q70_00017263 [Brassica cretica]|uniref:Uncharacterized protein n=1 Tax=Brassica cretica TaxID=69181 RepID=A0A8S9HZS2_BRACR|nr:hypothetical protein F2Q70_00017263 [Brassica cretica]